MPPARIASSVAVAIRSAGTFTKASASWTVAKVTCNGFALFAPWVGIDGDGSSTVEQTGVQTECNGSTPEYSAWYEMYPQSPVYYSDPISVGDTFNASVTANGTQFTLKISDVTKGWTESVTQSLASAQRLSAEAVIEAPGGYPDFQVQKFTNVTWPLMAGMYLVCTMLSTIWALGDFNAVRFISGGGPALSTHVLATLGIRNAFDPRHTRVRD